MGSTKKKISTILIRHLKKWGVSHIFGVPGKAVTPLIIEADNQGIEFVLSAHEGGGGFKAAGYAWGNETIGVAVGTSGPGGTNMVTAAMQAQHSHLPVLFITGQPTIKGSGRALGQDASPFGSNIVELMKNATKFSIAIDQAEAFPLYFQHAIEQAVTGLKGSVHLNIPADILAEEIEDFELDFPSAIPNLVSTNLDEVIEKLKKAKRPLLLAGKGVHSSRAYNELEVFAERFGIPVVTTPSGKGAFRTNHSLSLGAFGLGGSVEADGYLSEEIDILVVIGTKLNDMTLAGYQPSQYPQSVIHFDYEQKFIGKSIPVTTLSVLGDIKANLQTIIEKTCNFDQKDAPLIERFPVNSRLEFEGLIPHGDAIKVLRSELPGDSFLFGDCGSHTFYAVRDYSIYQPGTFIFDSNFGAMGHGIGYSIGAKAARPELTIVCLTGDGCMLMHGNEIHSAVNHHIPVIFIVLNNSCLDMVDKGMARHLGKAVGTYYDIPVNTAKLGEALGADSYQCFSEQDIRSAIQKALESKLPSVIEIIVDSNEIPPTMKRG